MLKTKRLTRRDAYGNADIIGIDSCVLYTSLNAFESNILTAALNRLADYEDTGLAPSMVKHLAEKEAPDD